MGDHEKSWHESATTNGALLTQVGDARQNAASWQETTNKKIRRKIESRFSKFVKEFVWFPSSVLRFRRTKTKPRLIYMASAELTMEKRGIQCRAWFQTQIAVLQSLDCTPR